MTIYIAFEGIDGSGKKTQTNMLKTYFEQRGFRVFMLDYPKYDSFIGQEVGRLLSGKDRANSLTLEPKSTALWYAVDRLVDYTLHMREIEDADVVIINRYTMSNLAFQTPRADDPDEMFRWICALEHEVFGLPVPDLYLILDVPATTAMQRKEEQLQKETRAYSSASDVYENNSAVQKSASDRYLDIAKRMTNVAVVPCYGDDQAPLEPDMIFNAILHHVQQHIPNLKPTPFWKRWLR